MTPFLFPVNPLTTFGHERVNFFGTFSYANCGKLFHPAVNLFCDNYADITRGIFLLSYEHILRPCHPKMGDTKLQNIIYQHIIYQHIKKINAF